MRIEPDQLREMAKQHERRAENIRNWGKIPHGWLDDFEASNGPFGGPVVGALRDYYDRRHRKAERIARDHEQTRDKLIASAKALEDNDLDGGGQVSDSGSKERFAPGGTAPHGPADPTAGNGRETPTADGAQWGRQPTPGDSPAPEAAGPADQATPGSGVSAPPGAPGLSDQGTAPVGVVPHAPAMPPETTTTVADTPGSDADGSAAAASVPAPGGSAGPADDGAGPAAVGTPLPGPLPPIGTTGGPTPPRSLSAGPLVSAVAAAGHRLSRPSLVVGDRAEHDLELARTLVAAILAAVGDSYPSLGWGVAVLRASQGPLVLVTSTEGRGWLPPGLFLPSEVFVPWRWDAPLGDRGRELVAEFEGNPDPARILAAFGLVAGRIGIGSPSALASSAAVADGVRAALGDGVAVEGNVRAAECTVDLSAPGAGLSDRLEMAGSEDSLRRAAEVSESDLRAVCLELARAADMQVRHAVTAVGSEAGARHARRQRVLDALQADLPVPAPWWDEIAAGSAGAGPESLRDRVFERRADEILLLLGAGEIDRHRLREVLYTYGQIAEHPQLPAAAQAVSAPTLPATGGGAISVGPIGRSGAPPLIAELSKATAGAEGSAERRRV
ncbi:type VII secretion target [Nocardia wallacei]|uniref:type VII secretion target n=1 Tax=Nocardia wallacei TaxID=480035 RepID=UPI002455ED21|nr:type VII secretion target [Nocardia wallacei]